MFDNCSSLTTLSKDFNISHSIYNVSSFFCSAMFRNCSSLVTLPAHFNLPQDIAGSTGAYFCSNMFDGCICLSDLTLNFNLPTGITTVDLYFCHSMFYNCSALTSNEPNFPINIPYFSSPPSNYCVDMFGGSCPIESDSPLPGEQVLVKRKN
jgi:hypothetical protein